MHLREQLEGVFCAAFRARRSDYKNFPGRDRAAYFEVQCGKVMKGNHRDVAALRKSGDPRYKLARQEVKNLYAEGCTYYLYAQLLFGFDYRSLLDRMLEVYEDGVDLTLEPQDWVRHELPRFFREETDRVLKSPAWHVWTRDAERQMIKDLYDSAVVALRVVRTRNRVDLTTKAAARQVRAAASPAPTAWNVGESKVDESLEGLSSPVDQIKYALEKGQRKEAVKLWQEWRRSVGKRAAKVELYRQARKDKSDFYKWEKGNLGDGTSAAVSIRRALTCDW